MWNLTIVENLRPHSVGLLNFLCSVILENTILRYKHTYPGLTCWVFERVASIYCSDTCLYYMGVLMKSQQGRIQSMFVRFRTTHLVYVLLYSWAVYNNKCTPYNLEKNTTVSADALSHNVSYACSLWSCNNLLPANWNICGVFVVFGSPWNGKKSAT